MNKDKEVGFVCYFGDLSSEEVEVINDYWLVTEGGGVNGGFAYSVSRVSERHGLREGDIRTIIKKVLGFVRQEVRGYVVLVGMWFCCQAG